MVVMRRRWPVPHSSPPTACDPAAWAMDVERFLRNLRRFRWRRWRRRVGAQGPGGSPPIPRVAGSAGSRRRWPWPDGEPESRP